MKLRELGEFGLIERLKKAVSPGAHAVVGIGDDAAVLESPGLSLLTLFTCDMLVEGRHFDLGRDAPRLVGRKAIACSLSDIAAMGGLPRAAVVSVGAPAEMDAAVIEELYAGIGETAERFGCGIVGGDTVGSGDGLIVSVALVGEVERGRVALRSGAEPGDSLWVTGRLGGSRKGRHLSFDPRIEEARFLVGHFPVKAMMDLSDGLANDSHRLAGASGVGVLIRGGDVPVDEEALGDLPPEEALRGAIYDGEDFELLVAIDRGAPREEVARAFASRFPCGITPVGEVVPEARGIVLAAGDTESPLEEGGFSHFG